MTGCFGAILLFKPFKTPGMDGIFPALIQKSIKVLAPILYRIFVLLLSIFLLPGGILRLSLSLKWEKKIILKQTLLDPLVSQLFF